MSKYIRRIVVALLSLVCFVACKGREGGEISETRKLLNDVDTNRHQINDKKSYLLINSDKIGKKKRATQVALIH